MATILAHITIKPGREKDFEALARQLYEVTHAQEEHCQRYEYWRGNAPGAYYTLLAFKDYHGFLAHQTSDHHESAVAALGEMIDTIRLEWLDPVSGASTLYPSNPQELPQNADDLVRHYAAMFPVEVPSWWQALR